MRGAARIGLGLAVLSASLALPYAALAQGPLPLPGGYSQELVVVSLNVLTPPQEVQLLGQAVYEVTVDDRSVDSLPDNEGFPHTTNLDLIYDDPRNSTGWSAFLGPKFFKGQAGDSFRTTATVIATPTVKTQLFRFTIRATMTSAGSGGPATDAQEVVAKLRPFSIATVNLPGAITQVGPFEDVSIPVVLRNEGQYPDAFLITAVGPEGWFVSVQPRMTLMPGEERTFFVQATSPATRVFTPQETAVILVQVRSERDPGTVYERATIVVLEGTFIPEYWAPVLAAGLVAAAATGVRGTEAARRRSKEQGRPGPPRVTPAQQVLLADLKVRDPERYRELVQRQRFALKTRERAYMAIRSRRAALEQRLLDRQHRQVREAKAAERAALREDEARERELERQKALLLREKGRRERALAAQQAREEARRRREEERRARLAAPDRRRLERQRAVRERQLRAELARKQRLLQAEQRKRRIELDQRRRVLERKRKEAERRARRAGKRVPEGPAEKKGGLVGRKPPEGGEGGPL